MTRILVHVEGQTEESFVNEVLAPHLLGVGYTNVSARLLGNARQRQRRGGVRQWSQVRTEILNHLKEDQSILATTMVDYYGLPETWPGRIEAKGQATLSGRASLVQDALRDDISKSLGDDFDPWRFVPYVVMHEFEGLLFSDPDRFARSIGQSDLSSDFLAIRNAFSSPEEINDSPDSAPSRRVKAIYKGYQKPLMGVLAVEEIGLETIRLECPLFNKWIEELEDRVNP